MNYPQTIIIAIIVVQSTLFGLYLLSNKSKEEKLRLLILLMFVIALHYANLFIGKIIDGYQGYVLSWMFLCLYGPLIYSITRSTLNINSKSHISGFLLPVYPFILWLFTDKLHMESSDDIYFDYWVSLPVYAVLFLYLFLSLLLLRNHKDERWSSKKLSQMIYTFCTMLILHLSALYYFSLGSIQIGNIIHTIELIFMAMLLSNLVWTALRRPRLHSDLPGIQTTKYHYTGLTKQESVILLDKLETFVRSQKPYLDPNLTLIELSYQSGIDSRQLSQVINENLNLNFNEYINKYRINEAIELLNDRHKDIRIFEVMYDTGFKSKSSFNMSFKKFKGCTPSVYRKELMGDFE